MSRLLHHLVSERAEHRPDATAVVSDGARTSYAQLDEASARLAAALVERGVGRGSRVCLLQEKTPASIVSILGVLKAGAAYVPLDPSSPAARTSKMLRSCDDRWVLASSDHAELVAALLAEPPSAGPWCVGWLDEGPGSHFDVGDVFTREEIDAAPPHAPVGDVDADDLAYVMFTSGSTGAPKGVTITHRNVLAFLDWAVPYFSIGPRDRNSAHPPLHFDLSVFDLFGTLAAGAELHLVPKRLNLLAPALARFIRDSELTQWFSVPSVLNYMMHAGCVSHGDFPALERLMWCGEVLPTPTLIHFMERLPHVRFTNLYGPTEATIASSYHTVEEVPADERADVPIGVPCAGEDLHVLGDDLAPVAAGVIAELYISGAGLSPGYWRDREKTSAAFLQIETGQGRTRAYRTGDLARVDDEGLVHYVGRADTQIKSRGYRIELGEIETALLALPSVREAAVVAVRSDGFEGWTICCGCVPAVPGGFDAAGVTAQLRGDLPAYMIPQRWLEYQRLPTNDNGKIDRPRLRADFQAEGQLVR